MRIAFDVNGTLDGSKGDLLKQIAYALYKDGHSIMVWSNSASYAVKACEDLVKRGIKAEWCMKYAPYEADERGLPTVDLAFDDDSAYASALAVKRFIFVQDIPENPKEFGEFLPKLVNVCRKG